MQEYSFIKDTKKFCKKRIIVLFVCMLIFIALLVLFTIALSTAISFQNESTGSVIFVYVVLSFFPLLALGQIIFNLIRISKVNDILADFNAEYLQGLENEYATSFHYKANPNVGYFRIGKYHIFSAQQGKLSIAPRADIANVDGISDPRALYPLNSKEVSITFYKHPKIYFVSNAKVTQEIREVLFQVVPGPQ